MKPRERNGYIVYGSWIGVWALLEYLGFKPWTPWPPLSDTGWYLQRRGRVGVFAALVLYGGLSVLQKHLVDHWPDRRQIEAWQIDPHAPR